MPEHRPPEPPQPPRSLWRDWSRLRILGLVVALVMGNFAWQIVAAALGGGVFLPVLVGALLGVGMPLLLLGRDNGWRPAADLGLDRPAPAVLVLAALLAVASLAPTSLLATLSARLHPVDPAWLADLQEALPRGPAQIVLACLAVVVAAPVVEEIIFRGLLHRLAASLWGAWPAALVSSIVFGLVHGQPWYLFGLIGIGIMLAFVYEATRSVTACALAHAVHNAVSLATMIASGSAGGEPEAVALLDLAIGAGSLVLALLIGRLLWQVGRPRSQTASGT